MPDPTQWEDTASTSPPRVHSHTVLTCVIRCEGDPTNGRRPPVVPGTTSLHPCRCPDSRRSPTQHLRTPHAGTARGRTPSHARRADSRNMVFCIWTPCACDSCNKITVSAHGMGSGGLEVDDNQSINQPFIVLTETKFSYRHIPVWARYSPQCR
jgi:hypothetical protein